MTPGRRTLRYESLDDVMPDVERLLEGHRTVGNWTLARICRHLADVMRRIVDLPASTPVDPSLRLDEGAKREVLATGLIPEGLVAPPETTPPEGLDEREEAEGLRRAIAYFQSSPGPVVPHRLFGPLSRDDWHRLQSIHCAHHLSFAVPTGRA